MRAISRFALTISLGASSALRLALEPEPEQVRLDLAQRQLELLVGLLAEFGRLAHHDFLLDPIQSDINSSSDGPVRRWAVG